MDSRCRGPPSGDPGPITFTLRRFEANTAAEAPRMDSGESDTMSLSEEQNLSTSWVNVNARSSSSSPNRTADRITEGCFRTSLERNASNASPHAPARTAISPSPPTRFAAWSARTWLISAEARSGSDAAVQAVTSQVRRFWRGSVGISFVGRLTGSAGAMCSVRDLPNREANAESTATVLSENSKG